jgi:exodeoxyribonuclease VII large subunit
VTSPTGAVIRDILTVLERRFENFDVLIYPVPVQGKGASLKIKSAIEDINKNKRGEVIILARGGGSIEELWAFNEREVADAIFYSKIPVISAIGHETDFTIADFVADMRAPTPSAAAEIVLPEKKAIKYTISTYYQTLWVSLLNFIKMKRSQLLQIEGRQPFKQPYNNIYSNRLKLDSLNKLLSNYVERVITDKLSNLRNMSGKLNALSPLNVLSRGYGVIRQNKDGQIIRTVKNIKKNDTLEIEITDGIIDCKVQNVKQKDGVK